MRSSLPSSGGFGRLPSLPVSLVDPPAFLRGRSSRPGHLVDLRAEPLGEQLVPAAPGVAGDLLLELAEFAKHAEPRLHRRQDLGGLDALRSSDEALEVVPVVVSAAELREEKIRGIFEKVPTEEEQVGAYRSFPLAKE